MHEQAVAGSAAASAAFFPAAQKPQHRPEFGRPRRPELLSPAFAVATLILIGLAGLAVVVPEAGMPASPVDAAGARAALQAGATVVATLSGAIFLAYARLSGSIESAWVGTAMLLLGVLTIGVATLWPMIDSSLADNEAIVWLQPASRLSVLAILALALWTARHANAWRRRPTRILLVTVATTAAATVALQLAPNLGATLASVQDQAFTIGTPWFGAWTLPMLWSVLGGAYIVVAARRDDALLAWIGLVCVAFAAAEVARVAAAVAGQSGSIGAHVVQTAGLACGLIGVMRGLVRAMREQRGHLLTRVERAEATADDARRRQREQVHEARNALSGIVNTLRMLEQQGDRLDNEIHRELLATTFSELVRLQHVFAASDAADRASAYYLSDTIAPVVAAARANGMRIRCDVPSDAVAWGAWAATAQALQNLLENARRHAVGATVEIDTVVTTERILLRVTDDGPGIPADERERIFESGVRGRDAANVPGSGLGLAITAELVARQRGALWAEEPPGGGARMVVALPTRPTGSTPADAGAGEAPSDDAHDHGQMIAG